MGRQHALVKSGPPPNGINKDFRTENSRWVTGLGEADREGAERCGSGHDSRHTFADDIGILMVNQGGEFL